MTVAVTSSPAGPTITERGRRLRWPLIIGAVMLVAAIVLAVVSSQQRRGYLDPQGVDRFGAGAVVQLLEDQGVEVIEARTSSAALAAATADGTVLVTVPGLLNLDAAQQLADTGADLVLVAPGDDVRLYLPDATFAPSGVEVRDPECDLEAAQRAGQVLIGGGYDVEGSTDATRCYPMADGASLLVVGTGAETITVLGAAEPLMNEHLDEEGNAALALNLLGVDDTLVWYRPSIEATPGDESSFTALLPDWIEPAVWQLGIAAALAAIWRGRRLGRLVPEPLPVAVPASETVYGRARLYRRGRSRGHAAGVLRAGSLVRIIALLGLPKDAPIGAVVAAAAARSGRDPAATHNLLAGPQPPDDAALVQLAHDLDTLEQEVRRP